MEKIRFDFNNMFSRAVGSRHGADEKDIEEISVSLKEAAGHLSKIISAGRNRIKLGLEWARLPYQDKKAVKELQDLGNEIAAEYG